MKSLSLDEQTTRQLALIRLLHHQGVEQAARPEPLSLFSLLTFHDSVELFLVLAADYLGVQLPQRDPGFLDYWHLLRRTNEFPAGVNLTGKGRMDRLNRNRNALKHAGAFPSRSAIDDALASTTSFFEDNTQPVFGVAFDSIDMADVVPQEHIRTRRKTAQAAETWRNRPHAMEELARAFRALFDPYAESGPINRRFGRKMPRTILGAQAMAETLQSLAKEAGSRNLGNYRSAGRNLDDNIAKLNQAVSAMQRGIRVLSLGIDYTRYARFEQLTPTLIGSDEYGVAHFDEDYTPTHKEYEFCVQFVISATLRLAEVEADTERPSWVQASLAE
jgi:hypothetical protein